MSCELLFSASSASSSPDQDTPALFTSPCAANVEQTQQKNSMQAQNTTEPLTGSDLPPSPLWRKWQLCSLTSTSARGLPARDRQTDRQMGTPLHRPEETNPACVSCPAQPFPEVPQGSRAALHCGHAQGASTHRQCAGGWIPWVLLFCAHITLERHNNRLKTPLWVVGE